MCASFAVSSPWGRSDSKFSIYVAHFSIRQYTVWHFPSSRSPISYSSLVFQWSEGPANTAHGNYTPPHCVSLGAQGLQGTCVLLLPILGFPATYLGRLWLECWGRATIPKLVSASCPPHLSAWLWAGLPYALQNIKVHSHQKHPSREQGALCPADF